MSEERTPDRRVVGHIAITALSDGHLDLPAQMLPKSEPQELRRLQDAAGHTPGDTVRCGLNAFLIEAGGKRLLVDSGGGAMAPSVGRLGGTMAAAGIDPASIDTVFLTHMHPDHVGGLVADGAAVFPDAELVVNGADWDFWTSAENLAAAPEAGKRFFQVAQQAVKPYDGRVRRIAGEEELMPGVATVPLPGHTPGHTGLTLVSGGETLLLWGDIVHAAVAQFAHPDWGVAFDIDPEVAAATRKRIFDQVATDRLMIAGMHLAGGFGHVVRAGNAYAFAPAERQAEAGA